MGLNVYGYGIRVKAYVINEELMINFCDERSEANLWSAKPLLRFGFSCFSRFELFAKIPAGDDQLVATGASPWPGVGTGYINIFSAA
jgi:hypothetical protein